jgi:hypothetical protein
MKASLLALGVGLLFTAAAAADVIVNAPFVNIRVGTSNGQGVYVNAPFTRVLVGQPAYSPTQPAVYVQAPFTQVVVGVAPPIYYTVPPSFAQPVDPKDMLHQPRTTGNIVAVSHVDFGKSFVPAPGTYEVVFIHPVTKRPCPVQFLLPPRGRPPVIRIEPTALEYDFGDLEVEIRFKMDGRVKVEYND